MLPRDIVRKLHRIRIRTNRLVEAGVGGEAWEIHGGGFYNVQKYLVAPRVLPETLHWFKWEAYTTWLSGFALMIVLYYLNADTYLIDKSVADLSTGEAVAISVGLLAAAWIVYDLLCRLLASRPLVLAALLLGAAVVLGLGRGQRGRGHLQGRTEFPSRREPHARLIHQVVRRPTRRIQQHGVPTDDGHFVGG